jgi:hypothetical protein
VFCPNCGTQNDSAASPCKKCGFKLSGVSAPKFKGTMMMNTEQSVQDLVDEHKRKREAAAQAGTGEAPREPDAPAPSPSAAPPAPSAAPPAESRAVPKGVLQPPRAGASKRRMGGTMLGVAPQAGGIIPPTPLPTPLPSPDVAPSQAPAAAAPRAVSASEPEPVPAAPELVSPPLRADPLAGTVAVPTSDPPEAGPAQGRTQALDATPPLAEVQPAPPPDPWALEPAPPPARTVQLPAQDSLPPLQELTDSKPAPRRVRPFEIFLIVATCGLYGLVMLMRQRKPGQ